MKENKYWEKLDEVAAKYPTLGDFAKELHRRGKHKMAEMLEGLEGEVNDPHECRKHAKTEPTNLLYRAFDVYGREKKEFVEKLSNIINIEVVEEKEEYIRIITKEVYVYYEANEKIEICNKYISLCKSMNDTVKIVPVN